VRLALPVCAAAMGVALVLTIAVNLNAAKTVVVEPSTSGLRVRDTADGSAYMQAVAQPYADALVIMEGGLYDANSDQMDDSKHISSRLADSLLRPGAVAAMQSYSEAAFKAASRQAPVGYKHGAAYLRYGSALLYAESVHYNTLKRWCRIRNRPNDQLSRSSNILACDRSGERFFTHGWTGMQAAFGNIGVAGNILQFVLRSDSKYDGPVTYNSVMTQAYFDVDRWFMGSEEPWAR
jgi:hypothetical protein